MEMKREDAVDVLFIAMPFCDEYMPCLTLASVLCQPYRFGKIPEHHAGMYHWLRSRLFCL